MTLVNADTGEIVVRLSDLEATIERGLATFVEVGEALAQIRDAKLYRESHETFEAYCQERWGFTANRARRLMEASEVAGMVPETVPMGTLNERQARELAPLKAEPEKMAEALAEAADQAQAEDRKPTAADVREAVRKRVDPLPPAKAETFAKADDRAAELDLDKRARAAAYEQARDAVRKAVTALGKLTEQEASFVASVPMDAYFLDRLDALIGDSRFWLDEVARERTTLKAVS